ncbi:hypothetical protein ACGFSG_26025 [Streptomyces sp. NPDC048512]|uniref:hypothetical protein n=1 Tax=unclassified Streptomyces TaxID=2593676 RepID=UPI0009BCEBFD|nr:hypothetical protein [Streptomyces sp. M41(2017)]OQQ13805.1 hypothetical protein B0675_26595 [Streptomyces sp. M41(2017)]
MADVADGRYRIVLNDQQCLTRDSSDTPLLLVPEGVGPQSWEVRSTGDGTYTISTSIGDTKLYVS